MLQYVAVLTAAAAAVGAAVAAVGLWFAWLQMRNAHLWNRRKASFDYMNEWDLPEVRAVRARVMRVADPFDPQQTYSTKEELLTEEHRDAIRMVLNYFDSTGSGIRLGILDEKICHETMAANVYHYFRWARPYVLTMREVEPRAWEEIDAMIERWMERDRQRKQESLPTGYKKLPG